jgi:capsid portal protein
MAKVQDGDAVVVDKATTTLTPTAGDAAPRATSDPSSEVDAEFIPYPTGGAERSDPGTGAMDIGPLQYLRPPEDPATAYQLHQLSPYLAPHIRAMESNVYAAGYDLVLDEVLDCDPEALTRKVRNALRFAKSNGPDQVPEVAESEVTAYLKKLESRILWEEHYLKRFFAACCPDMHYLELEALTGQDLEITGNAYHEVLRDRGGRITKFNWSPAKHTRAVPIPLNTPRVGVLESVRDPILGYFPEPQFKKFRTYALLSVNTNMVQTYFKEFGDPRVLSRKTGKFYPDMETLHAFEGTHSLPATELFHYRIPWAGSTAYGKGEWSGMHPTFEGSRDLDEENLKFIHDEVMPSLLMMIAGPRIGKEERERFERQVRERAARSGRGMLFLNAYDQANAPGAPTGAVNLKVERLKSEQVNEAIFTRYDQRAEEKAHMAWRLPGLAMGVVPQRMDKATAGFLSRFAEDQVYTPRRSWYDRCKNTILDAMLVQCWRYRCRGVPPRDPEALAKIIQILMDSGVLNPDEGRNLSEIIFNTKFADLPGAWSSLPTKLLIAVLQTKNPTLAAALMHDGELSMEKLAELLHEGMEEAAEQVQGEIDDAGKSDDGESDSVDDE